MMIEALIAGETDPIKLEHFPAKWMPVCVEKMRQNKELERDEKKWVPVFRSSTRSKLLE